MVAAVSPPALDKNWRRLGELIALSLCESARLGCRAIDVPPVKAESPRTDRHSGTTPRGISQRTLRSSAAVGCARCSDPLALNASERISPIAGLDFDNERHRRQRARCRRSARSRVWPKGVEHPERALLKRKTSARIGPSAALLRFDLRLLHHPTPQRELAVDVLR